MRLLAFLIMLVICWFYFRSLVIVSPKILTCCHSNHRKTWLKVPSHCFLKSGGNANICILKTFTWMFPAYTYCVHVFLVKYMLWRLFKIRQAMEECSTVRSSTHLIKNYFINSPVYILWLDYSCWHYIYFN